MIIRDGSFAPVIRGTVGTGGVVKGSLCVLSSNTFVKAAAATTDGTIAAIALETADAAAVAKFQLVSNTPIISAKYTGSSKTSLTDADISKIFDLSSDLIVNLDDTSGGCAFCVDYDNSLSLIDFIIAPAKKAV